MFKPKARVLASAVSGLNYCSYTFNSIVTGKIELDDNGRDVRQNDLHLCWSCSMCHQTYATKPTHSMPTFMYECIMIYYKYVYCFNMLVTVCQNLYVQ